MLSQYMYGRTKGGYDVLKSIFKSFRCASVYVPDYKKSAADRKILKSNFTFEWAKKKHREE